MLIDHTGCYFFFGHEWWRAIGRLCVPIWFFLIGYSRSQKIEKEWYIAASLLVITDIVMGNSILALNILFTMIVIRILLMPVLEKAKATPQGWYMLLAALVVLLLPSASLFEYGTGGVALAITGVVTRRPHDFTPEQRVQAFLTALLLFVAFPGNTFAFSLAQNALVAAGTAVILFGLHYALPRQTVPALFRQAPIAVRRSLMFIGRNTLWIYAGHLTLLKLIVPFL